MAAAAAMQVASTARFRRSATGAAVVATPSPSNATFFAAAAPVGSRRKARPSPTTSPAGTRKVLRTRQRAAARPLHVTAASTTAEPSAAGNGVGEAGGEGTCMELSLPAPPATINPSATPPASLPLAPPIGAAVPTAAAAPDGGTAANTVSDDPANDSRGCRRGGGGERGLARPSLLGANDRCTRDRCTDGGDLGRCGRAG